MACRVREMAGAMPVVVLTGARQVGKSTMLREEFADYDYLTFDDYSILEQARIDPDSLWVGHDRIIIDEAQKFPKIFPAIKLAVDQSQRAKHFILSGSANLYLMEKVTESLAGRAAYCALLPLSFGEMKGKITPSHFLSLWETRDFPETGSPMETNLIEILQRGFMPPLLRMETHQQILIWMDGYVKTYLERDLRELSQVKSLIDFRKVMQCLSLRTGQILNQAEVAKDCSLSHATTHRYIKLLEISNIISRVPAYYASRNKRMVKAPKVYFLDPALAIFLSGYMDQASLSKSRELRGFFETLVYLQLRQLCALLTPMAEVYYWRTSTHREVDFIIEHGRIILPIEVKLTQKPTVNDIGSLLAFLEEHPHAPKGVLVHNGTEILWLHSKVIAVPWWWLDF